MATGCFRSLLEKEIDSISQLQLVENDTTNLQITLEENISTTLLACNFHIKYDDENVVVVPCKVIDGINGILHTQFKVGDLIGGGPYRVEIELRYYDGTIETLNRDIDGNLLYLMIDEELN